MLTIEYNFSQHYNMRYDVIIFDLSDSKELDFHTNNYCKKFLKLMYIPEEVFTINIEDEIYTKHYFIVSCVNFKFNYRYFGSVMSDDKMVIYYSGRELTLQETKQGKKIHRPKVPIDEIILKTIFGGLNSYKVLGSQNVVHFLKFSPIFLYYYKYILNAIRFFFDLKEHSLRFAFLYFKEPLHIFKKIRSIKKNLKKKNAIKARRDDYGLITL